MLFSQNLELEADLACVPQCDFLHGDMVEELEGREGAEQTLGTALVLIKMVWPKLPNTHQLWIWILLLWMQTLASPHFSLPQGAMGMGGKLDPGNWALFLCLLTTERVEWP